MMPEEFAKPLVSEGEVFVAGKHLSCLVCGGGQFTGREVMMNTTGLTLMGLDHLNKTAAGVICNDCGYVHLFMGRTLEWCTAD